MINLDKDRYAYMYDMEYKKSAKRKRMTQTERAAQFGAFRALTGYEDEIEETGRITDAWLEPDEYEKEQLDIKLRYIRDNIDSMPQVIMTYFTPDDRKKGGKYFTKNARVKRLREFERRVVFSDGEEVPIDFITSIEIINGV
jgi:hypothetical protein